MKSENKNIFNFFSFIVLVIVALLILVNNLLPLIGVEIKGAFFGVLTTIKEVFILIVVGFSAYWFVASKKKAWKIIYWIAIALFVTGIVLYWFI